jgi:hypothetical protein
VLLLLALGSLGCRPEAHASQESRTWHVRVDAAAGGLGTAAHPWTRIGDALNRAEPGDTVVVGPGTYAERLHTVRGGTPARPILVRAADAARPPMVTALGRVATLAHPHIHVDGLILDGQYGEDDTVRVADEANSLVLRRVEVRRSGRDCVDMAGPSDVRFDAVRIHHCLDARGGRRDAHGIVAGAVRRLAIRHAEIHTFSGDGIQVDPGRAAPGWSDVTIESSRIWLAPLPEPANGFAAGTVPGENALDTKTMARGPRAALYLRDVEAWGFEGGLIRNMAAFNLKERVDVTIDGATVHHSEIAFRVRGAGDAGASVDLQNIVLHHVGTGIRYEDDVARLRVRHMTAGRSVGGLFRRVATRDTVPVVDHLLFLGPSLPPDVRGRGLAVASSAFLAAEDDDYRLVGGSPAVDAARGPVVASRDRRGLSRPQGAAPDLGAHEWCPDCPSEETQRPAAGTRRP